MYTANIVDTGPFRAVGKPPNDSYSNLKAAVTTVDATLSVPSTMYEELGGTLGADTYPSGSEYVDDAIRNGWVRVAEPVLGDFDDDYADAATVVEQARHDAHHVIAAMTNHPKTVNEWNDTAIVGVAVRLFERNEQIRVIVHTTDQALQKAVQVVVPHYGYYDVKTRYYPPKTMKDRFPVAENFTW
jgi:hypothetical protein